MQWYRSGHNEHDWKSCCRQKRHEGSNPSHCAKRKALPDGRAFLLAFTGFEDELQGPAPKGAGLGSNIRGLPPKRRRWRRKRGGRKEVPRRRVGRQHSWRRLARRDHVASVSGKSLPLRQKNTGSKRPSGVFLFLPKMEENGLVLIIVLISIPEKAPHNAAPAPK